MWFSEMIDLKTDFWNGMREKKNLYLSDHVKSFYDS